MIHQNVNLLNCTWHYMTYHLQVCTIIDNLYCIQLVYIQVQHLSTSLFLIINVMWPNLGNLVNLCTFVLAIQEMQTCNVVATADSVWAPDCTEGVGEDGDKVGWRRSGTNHFWSDTKVRDQIVQFNLTASFKLFIHIQFLKEETFHIEMTKAMLFHRH